MKQVKIRNLEELQAWQAELRSESKQLETEISYRFYFLKTNIPAILLHQLFPGKQQLNDRLGDLLQLLFIYIIGKVTGSQVKPEESILERIFAWFSEKFQTWFGRNKSEQVADSE